MRRPANSVTNDFARLLLDIRRRVAALPDDGRRREAIERIAREILAEISVGEQADKVRRILAAFLGLGEGDTFDAALLEQTTLEPVLQFIAAESLELGRTSAVTGESPGNP